MCAACLVGQDEGVLEGHESPAKWKATYDDTFSAAIDRLENLQLGDDAMEKRARAQRLSFASPSATGGKPFHCASFSPTQLASRTC